MGWFYAAQEFFTMHRIEINFYLLLGILVFAIYKAFKTWAAQGEIICKLVEAIELLSERIKDVMDEAEGE